MASPTRSAREQFDRQAQHYNAQWNAWSAENLRWLVENAACRPKDRVLDVATGTGYTAMAFAPRVESVIGLDVSTGMLAEARRKAEEAGLSNLSFVEGEAEAMPFPDVSFDIVTCRIAAHHFLSVENFVREAMRVLKPGGKLLVTDTSVPDDAPEADAWQNEIEVARDPSHVRNYSLREWRSFVEEAGFMLEHATDAGAGIRIPVSDWLVKGGCTPEQAARVRSLLENAPEAAIRAYQIAPLGAGDYSFSWRRILLRAQKPGGEEEHDQ